MFIKRLTGGGETGEPGEAHASKDDEDVDYDELPFKIYKIECDNALTIEKECNFLNYHEMRKKYDNIRDEVDDGGVLEECFDDDDKNDNRYFFIENKACFVIFYEKQVLYWKPHNLADVDDINWDKEFLSMKKDICDYFGIINDHKLKMVNGEDKDIEMEQGVDIEEMWGDVWDDDDEAYLRILVIGNPLIEFVIDCTNIGNAHNAGDVSESSLLTRKIGLDVSKDANNVFLQFGEAFEHEFKNSDVSGSNWINKYKLIDNCYRVGNIIDNGQTFLEFYRVCKRKKINPICIQLEMKVSKRNSYVLLFYCFDFFPQVLHWAFLFSFFWFCFFVL